MDIMQKLTFCALQKNKKRTIVTIIGIILSTALITAVACMAESLRASMVAYEKKESGDYHYYFYGVDKENIKYFENNRNIEKLGYEIEIGYAELEGGINENKPYLYVLGMTEEAMHAASANLIKGRMPEKEGEILISRHTLTNGGADIKIGDILNLELGEREDKAGNRLNQFDSYAQDGEVFVPREEKTYTVVGMIERLSYNIEGYTAPGYTAITCIKQEDIAGKVNIYANYTKKALKNKTKVTAGLLGVTEDILTRYEMGESLTEQEWYQVEQVADYYNYNQWLLKWELLDFSNSTMNLLYSMCGVAVGIIIFASVFCIRNSFVISLTEKMKLYGMIASVGATKKQRKKMVYTEAAFFGIIGVPLGIFSGVFATWVLIKVTGFLFAESLGIELVYVTSVSAMIIGGILSAVTVFLSAGQSARKVRKLTPIQAIRGNDFIKLSRRNVKIPAFVHRFFGIGGTIAYKNLKRSRAKYRATVVSIVVSVSIFIGMTTFIEQAFFATTFYYEDKGYQLLVHFYSEDAEKNYKKALETAEDESVSFAEVRRMIENFEVPSDTLPFNEKFIFDSGQIVSSESENIGMGILSLGTEAYEKYCKEVGIAPEANENKAILIADYDMGIEETNGKKTQIKGMMYDYEPGDKISGIFYRGDIAQPESYHEEEIEIELSAVTDIRPLSLKNYAGMGYLIVSDEWMEQYEEYISQYVSLYLLCEDAYTLEDDIIADFEEDGMESYYITNEEAEYKKVQSLYLLIAIFLYGFITVIALIGITNIFNTITTNMELRSREFAMLKSIGMTGKEFRRMICLESIFYGGKSLIIGILAGCGFSYLFYIALMDNMDTSFKLPFTGIMIATAAVIVLLFTITRYSMGKINQKNIIETIQNENI